MSHIRPSEWSWVISPIFKPINSGTTIKSFPPHETGLIQIYFNSFLKEILCSSLTPTQLLQSFQTAPSSILRRPCRPRCPTWGWWTSAILAWLTNVAEMLKGFEKQTARWQHWRRRWSIYYGEEKIELHLVFHLKMPNILKWTIQL